ncbi:MAG: ABC transporter permease [Candidatus Microsaccharimonas sp.]
MPTLHLKNSFSHPTVRLVLQNVALIFASLIIVYSVTFVVFELMPGRFYDTDVARNDQAIENIVVKYGLDEDPFSRYIKGLGGLLTLNFGQSYVDAGRSVNEIIKQHAPVSFLIGAVSLIVAIGAGLCWSILLFQRKKMTRAFDIIGLVVLSTPVFIIAILLQYVIAVQLGWLPVYGITYIASFILPVVVLSIVPMIIIAQVLMADMRKTTSSLYVQAARVRGVDHDTILFEYILRNSLTTTLTYLAPIAATILAGSFVVESIFNIPGLGRYFVTAITNRDYPVIAGLTVFYSILIIGINAFASIMVNILNRRFKVDPSLNVKRVKR